MKRPTRARGRVGRRILLGLCVATMGSAPAEGLAQSMPGSRVERSPATEPSNGRMGVLALSLLCPGLGHLKLGRNQRALPYLLAEGGIWTTFAVSEVQGSWRRDSYIQQAELEAGVARAKGQSDSYYRLIGVWPSSESFNEVIRREARSLYPEDLVGRAAYVEANRVGAEIAWSWESQAAWDRYREKRNDSRLAYRRGRYMLGLAVANRVVAMIDATLLAHGGKGERALRLEMVPGGEPGAASLQLSWRLP